MTEPHNEEEEPGVIYPPPEIRIIVDKTAKFISTRGGLELEAKVREKERQNPKFSFLNPGDPYYPYYQIQLNKARHAQTVAIEKQSGAAEGGDATDLQEGPEIPSALPVKEQPRPPVKSAPKQPPPFEFCQSTPIVNAQDLEIVKLTALFVARNGRQFMNQLAQREAKNYQFDFLRQGHSLFNYFTKLVEQYTKVLLPGDDIMRRLRGNVENPFAVLDRCVERSEWERYQEEDRKLKEKQAEEERVAFMAIDWHDFVVIQTVEITSADEQLDLPAPMTIEAVQNMTIIQRKSLFSETGQQQQHQQQQKLSSQQQQQARQEEEEEEMEMDMD